MKFRRAFIKFIAFVKNRKIRRVLKNVSSEEIHSQLVVNLLSNQNEANIKSIKVALNDNGKLDLIIYNNDEIGIWFEDGAIDEILPLASCMLEYWLYNENKNKKEN